MANASLNTDDVRAIAELAKLHLSDDEITTYAEKLSQILEYFTLLQTVDTSSVTGTTSVLPPTSQLRADVVAVALPTHEALRNAPEQEEHQFKVNVVLGDESS